MTLRLTLPAPLAVLVANGLVNWTTIPACIACDDTKRMGEGSMPGGYDCPFCEDSGRNPLLDVAGRPCPTCNGTMGSGDGDRYYGHLEPGSVPPCEDCIGTNGYPTGLLTVEIWTDTRAPFTQVYVGDWWVLGDDRDGYRIELPKVERQLRVPLGVQVGTCTLAEALPIVGPAGANGRNGHDEFICHHGRLWMMRQHPRNSPEMGWAPELGENIDHLLPYADWTPARWAVRLTNLTPKDPT